MTISPERGNFHPATPETAILGTDQTPPEPATSGQPTRRARILRQLDDCPPYMRGKMIMALALGISQREAEAWFDITRNSIGHRLQTDPTFRAEVAEHARLALLHPVLRIQQAAGRSWRAARWLYDFLSSREGETPVEELIESAAENVTKDSRRDVRRRSTRRRGYVAKGRMISLASLASLPRPQLQPRKLAGPRC